MRITAYSLILSALVTGVVDANNSIQIQNKQNKQPIVAAKKEPIFMIDFTEQQSLDSWRITNDGVMGGKSKGRFLLQQDKALFEGDISLDNNGGFSSVSSMIEPLPKGLKDVTINIKGDGLTYQIRMTVNLDGYRMAYKQSFNTVSGQQEKLSFTLADFQASFRGRDIPNAPILLSENILEVGFLVTRKVVGAFSLAISSVAFK